VKNTGKELSVDLDTGLLARVEGHADIYVKLSQRGVVDVHVKVVETARFFEAMLMGRLYKEVPVLASRICGICDYAHALTATEAIESALGFKPSEGIMLLRELLAHADNIYSHALHLYLLALPDYYGFHDVVEMASKHMDAVKRGMRLKALGNYMATVIGGRATMNLACVVGGFTKVPRKDELHAVIERLRKAREDARITVDLFQELSPPANAVRGSSVYAAIYKMTEYPLVYAEGVATDKGDRVSKEEFSKRYTETSLPYSKAKFGSLDSDVVTVGAMARYNIARGNLHPVAYKLSNELGLGNRLTDRFQNNTAQAIELVHSIERSIDILDNVNLNGIKRSTVFPRAGNGVGITEAPRGILMHHYELDDSGKVKFVNIVTPTSINVASIESDLRTTVPILNNTSNSELTSYIEMLIRAYDPCFSCSAHSLHVKVEES